MCQSRRNWYWQLGIATSLAMCGAIAFSKNYLLAQPIPDDTLGAENSTVTGNVDIDGVPSNRIDGGARRGNNLFHSFREFNIDEGRGVYFTNPVGVENILSRVIGKIPSKILGTLGVVGNANLFLINPNGIIFGANASLDVGGSFVASTASSFKFANEAEFSATNPQTSPLLTVSVPIGLQFGEKTGNIQVQGNGQGIRLNSELIDTDIGLRVQPNQTLALVGGDLALEGGTLKTAGGRIELGSVAGSGLVSLNNTDKGFALNYESVPAFGEIRLSNVAVADASGLGGGDIQVTGKQVTLQDGSQIEASTLGSEPGGTLTVRASESIELSGSSRASNGEFSGGVFTKAYPETTGTAGNLRLYTGKLIVRDGAQASSGTFQNSQGRGGDLSVTANTIELKGTSLNGEFGSGLFTQTQGTGDAGDLTLDTRSLTVQDGALVSASTFGLGKGGELRIRADDSIALSGTGSTGFSSGLFTSTRRVAQAGNITIDTNSFQIVKGARVSVSSTGGGRAGELNISARSIQLDNRGAIAASTASGQGGNIDLQAQNFLTLRRNSRITTNAGGVGNGGNINIDTNILTDTENSNITANAIAGAGGNIQISAQGLFLSPDSAITASSEQGIDGVVEINRPDFDPNNELVILPTEIVDVSGLIAQGCAAEGNRTANEESQFLVTGRGGLPPTPQEALNSDNVVEDWGIATAEPQQASRGDRPKNNFGTRVASLVEAQGWQIGDRGEVVLTANATDASYYSPKRNSTGCHAN